MKTPKTTIILIVVLCLILFFTGLYFYESFLNWILPQINGVKFEETTLGGQFQEMTIFSLSIALIPVSLYLTWKIAPIIYTKQKVLSIVIICGSVFTSALVRKKWLMIQSDIYLKDFATSFAKKHDINVAIEHFAVSNYMLLGLAAGTAISYLGFKQKGIAKR